MKTLLGFEVDPGSVDDYLATLWVDEENRVASCMKAEGFDYTPVSYESANPPSVAVDASFVAEHGFGISMPPTRADESTNPNDATFTALDEGAQQAWIEQLDRCHSAARSEIDDVYGIDRLVMVVDDIREAVELDTSVLDAVEGWRRCMRDAGYEHGASTPEELESAYSEAWLNLLNESADAAAIEAFQGDELAVANASWSCAAELRSARSDATARAIERLYPKDFGHLVES